MTIEPAIQAARREGAEAMREAIVSALALAVRHQRLERVETREAVKIIRALPLLAPPTGAPR